MKNSYITVTDQFCGAGGSSQGVRNFSNSIGGGVEVKLALNHWDLAFLTQTVRQSMAMVMPFVPVARGQSKAHKITDPLSTQSQMINHGIVTTEAFNSFISYYYGTAQSSHISDPLGTTTTKDRYQLISYQTPQIEDCYYRMIKPPEIKKAMAFDDDYVILGSGKDQVKQCGNAVTPPVMEWLIQQCVKSLAA